MSLTTSALLMLTTQLKSRKRWLFANEKDKVMFVSGRKHRISNGRSGYVGPAPQRQIRILFYNLLHDSHKCTEDVGGRRIRFYVSPEAKELFDLWDGKFEEP